MSREALAFSERLRVAQRELAPVWSHARAERVEHAMYGRRRRRRRRRRVGAGAGGLALVIALAVASPWSSLAPTDPVRGLVATAVTSPSPVSLELLELLDGSRAEDQGGAVLTVVDDALDGSRVRLSAGRARFSVVHRPQRRFVVEAGRARVEVLGTEFSVERLPGGAIGVEVEHGRVRVVADGHQPELLDGQSLVVNGEDAPLLEAPVGNVRKQDAVELAFRAADRARRKGRTDAALAALLPIVADHAKDPRAALAALTVGRIFADARGEHASAASYFARAVALDPTGPLASDARAREALALWAAGSRDEARERAAEYLRRHPRGVHRAVLEALVR